MLTKQVGILHAPFTDFTAPIKMWANRNTQQAGPLCFHMTDQRKD